MKIVNVIPLVRVIGKETLMYFTSKDVSVGSYVSVPIRNKEVLAFVVSVHDVQSSKISIKKLAYGLKKISKVYGGDFLLPAFIKATERLAKYFIGTTGAVLETLTSQPILTTYLSKQSTKTIKKKDVIEKKSKKKTSRHEKFLFQASENDRFASYKSLIREYFAKRESVFICLPTIQDIESITPLLSKGIEEYTFIFHGDIAKKVLYATWEKALSHEHPILIIATGTYLSLPRDDIGIIIVEKENSNAYKTMRRPFIDIRVFAEFLTKELDVKLIFGDTFLRIETLYRKEKGEFLEFAPIKFRSISQANQKLLDMKKYKTLSGDNKFVLIGDDVIKNIETAQKNNESYFLLTSRRGLYPITICNDCNETIQCAQCAVPLVLHKEKKLNTQGKTLETNVFVCHACGKITHSRDLCQSCGSWRFATLGIGSERVYEKLKKLFPDKKVLLLDKDTASTKNKALKIINEFYSSENNILIGTEMAIPYLHKDIPHTAIISVDSLFTIPDFRIQERIFSLLLRLRARTIKSFFIQTRLANTALFKSILQGNLIDFYREELVERKRFNYPPFSTLIKFSRTGKQASVEYDMEKLKVFLKNYNPVVFPALFSGTKNKYTLNALLRIDTNYWPDDTIQKLLMKIPLSFSIKVDPEDIL